MLNLLPYIVMELLVRIAFYDENILGCDYDILSISDNIINVFTSLRFCNIANRIVSGTRNKEYDTDVFKKIIGIASADKLMITVFDYIKNIGRVGVIKGATVAK